MMVTRAKAALASEKGSVSALGVAMTLLLAAMLALAVDLGIAFATSIHQNSMMQIAREESQSTANGFLVKSAADPLAELSSQCIESIRAQGFDGKIEVDAWEAGASLSMGGKTLPSNKRVIAYEIRLDGTSPAIFARMAGIESIPVSATGDWNLILYSNSASWRPQTASAGATFTCEAGKDASTTTRRAATLDSMGDGVKTAAEEAFAALP